jgi:(1->4)-alpha-D-glucan 1-alpha-D-glucosylmutase
MNRPLSTYRLQLRRDFGFADARALVPYLHALGVTHCYTSPMLAALSGSDHGYDICDHGRLNPDLGSTEDHDAFVAELHRHGMGLIVDVVPNHMGVDPQQNPWWHDVLENGPASAYAHYFDIDWKPVKPELENRVLLAILGDQYGKVLERGDLRIVYDDGRFGLQYGERRLPINPRTAAAILRHKLPALRAELSDEEAHVRELLSILTALDNLPPFTETDPERLAEGRREKEIARERLARLAADSPRVRRHVEDALSAYNGRPGDPGSFVLLHNLLERQPYRLSYWRTASHEINYRRFFDVNHLAGVRIEEPDVFAATHSLTLGLIEKGHIDGLRIDHPDGLFDPAAYFVRLREASPAASLYIVAEKILSRRESLPDWPVQGTTGYNFLNDLNGLFIGAEHARKVRRAYQRFAAATLPFAEVLYRSKKLIMETAMSSELNVLAHELNRISESNWRSRDFTLNSLRDVLEEVVASFPVYRTYVSPAGWSATDREHIEAAVRQARQRNPAMEPSIFDFLREVLLPRGDAPAREEDRFGERRVGYPPTDPDEVRRRLHFSMKFQQYTAPVLAKGLEDTAFFRYNVLLSLNEVGGHPDRIGCTPEDFHQANAARRANWPHEMIATSTHDTKLGEDVRARINALSELADDWRREVSRWARVNATNRTTVDGEPAPDRNDEYRFYQVLVGAWPEGAPPPAPPPHAFVDRMRDYMIKAIKEAKLHTSWITDNQAYDDATARFVERTLTGPTAARFLPAFAPFQRRVAAIGVFNSLAQVVLKIASPGVPDFYQGCELWDLSLVDPDNRQPVDYERRRTLLAAIEPSLCACGGIGDLLRTPEDPRIKLLVTAASLRFRRQNPDLFLEGEYVPLAVDVPVAGGLFAFARVSSRACAVVVAPRLAARLVTAERPLPLGADVWKESRVRVPDALAGRMLRNLFTGEDVAVIGRDGAQWIGAAEALNACPVALLHGQV